MPRLWEDTGVAMSLSVGSTASKLSLVSSIVDTRYNQMTLLRTIIGLDVARFTHDSGEGSEQVSLGIGIASPEAFNTALALSDPEVDADFPTRGWIWRGRYRIYGFAADQPAVFNARVDLDLRSMRKLENGIMYFAAQSSTVEGTSSLSRVSGLIRQLWLVS